MWDSEKKGGTPNAGLNKNRCFRKIDFVSDVYALNLDSTKKTNWNFMRYLLVTLLLLTFAFQSKSQTNVSFYETVTYINNILSSNNKDRWCVYKMQADKFGNVKFFCTMGQYWFNINDALDVTIDYFFSFPSDYKVKCSMGGECDMGYLLDKNNERENAVWPGSFGGFQFSNLEYQDLSRLAKAFKHLKSITKDPFKD